ncbi:hypothetical protein ASPCAL08491 [Aspergillus calidoustus]|uniref:Uncharacterized protein n=1 Tax=Aspergillus calidoustus TaxID=454130 RepID=A0A0U5GWY9_ASPCI|nr:hypothetical protein ASPCAL08491 [Aspergillus calidoustus]
MSQPHEATDIWIFWLPEKDHDLITFIPTAQYNGGRVLTTLLFIEDKYSSVRMQENSLIDISGWKRRLPLGVFRGGRGSVDEVHRILKDCVEEYDPADEQFWYQRLYEDLIDENGRYLYAHDMEKYVMDMKSLVAMMLLFGHTTLPEKYRNPEGLKQPRREEYPQASGYGCKCGCEYYGAYTAYTQYASYTHFEPQQNHQQQQRHYTYTYQLSQAPPEPQTQQQYTYQYQQASHQLQAQAQARAPAPEPEPRRKHSSSKHRSKTSCSQGPPPMTKEAERAFRKHNEQSKKKKTKGLGFGLYFV